jgi:simple sugar transport system substrate-binding protein
MNWLVKALCLSTLATLGLTTNGLAQERYAVIGGPTSDTFWTVVRRGAEEAGKDLNVEVDYLPMDEDTVASTGRLIQTVTAQKPDGLVMPISTSEPYRDLLHNLEAAGVALVAINSGVTTAADMGSLVFIGQTDTLAGEMAGAAAKKMDQVKKVICVNHFIFVPESTQRCNGFKKGSGAEVIEIDASTDPTAIAQRVQATLSAHPDVDGILTLGPTGAIPTIDLIKKIGLNGKIHFYTFDLNSQILSAISDGTIGYAIDQQPFLQGYLAIVTLHAHKKFGVAPVGTINSGPALVTKADVEKLKQGAADGFR